MDFFQLIDERQSIRAYSNQPVPENLLTRILEAANMAPSAGDLQGYEIYLVASPERKADLVRAAFNQEFIAEAPLLLIFCANPARSAVWYKERGINLYCIQDATIACAFAMLAVTALGLASVWVGAFDDEAVRKAADIPQELRPVAILPIGYAGKKTSKTPRRPLEELVHVVK